MKHSKVGFETDFHKIGSRTDFTIGAWRTAFLSSALPTWEKVYDGKARSIEYTSENGANHDLTIGYEHPDGFVITHVLYNAANPSSGFNRYHINTSEASGEMIEIDQVFMPKECYLSIEQAWLIVSDFLQNPTEMSTSVSWVGAEDLDWPDIF